MNFIEQCPIIVSNAVNDKNDAGDADDADDDDVDGISGVNDDDGDGNVDDFSDHKYPNTISLIPSMQYSSTNFSINFIEMQTIESISTYWQKNQKHMV